MVEAYLMDFLGQILPILVIFAPIWPDIEQVTLTNHTSNKGNSCWKWPNNPRTDAMPTYISIGEGCQLNFFQITFFSILVIFAIFAPIWPDIEQVTLTNHTSHKDNSCWKWPNNPRTDAMPTYISIGEGCQLNFFHITFFPILVIFARFSWKMINKGDPPLTPQNILNLKFCQNKV